ncbi:MAG: hypothetical protein VB858_19685 [Planctomycetaceae bacterium]
MTAKYDSQKSGNNEPLQVARASPFTIAAYVTLLADTYLVLASLASRMMKEAYSSYLLPFSGDRNPDETDLMVLIIATWTAVPAVGCLSSRRRSSNDNVSAAVVWIVLVLAIPWLFVLIPTTQTTLNWAKQLFLYGP